MINKNIGRLRLKIYDNIGELPIERYHKFNTYCLLSMGIGSDIESIDNHIAEIFQALHRKDYDRLTVNFTNYYHSLRLIQDHMDIPSVAFACLVHSINDQEITDISEENLRIVSGRLTQAKRRELVINLFRELKKKLRTILRHTFRRKL